MNDKQRWWMGVAVVAMAAAGMATPASAQKPDDPYLRYPDAHGARIVFSYAGDLWLQRGSAGQAERLTSAPGAESFAKFSPDGRWIAFTGQIDGDDQVYVMSADGGAARQLTFDPAKRGLNSRWGPDNQVMGWTPDGKSVLFRSHRDLPMISQSNLYTVEVATGLVEAVGLPRAGAGVFSPDGAYLLYSPWSRDFRTWKRYRGGWAQDLWIFDRKSRSIRNLTHTDASERDPIWTRAGIFFLSDRNGRMNLFRQDPAGGSAVQVTHHDDDAMWASADPTGRIVYEVAGRIWSYDPATSTERLEKIIVSSEDLQARPRTVSVADRIVGFAPLAGGKRAVFEARGDIFSVPAGDGPVYALTHSSDAQDRLPEPSPDGTMVAYVSDRGGEEELWLVPATGGVARRLTSGHHERFARPVWSPDGSKIAISGKDGAILIADVAGGALRPIARSGSRFVNEYSWSPDSRYLAFVRTGATAMRQVMVVDTATGTSFPASDPLYNAESPAFSPDGHYLYFLSDREFATRFTRSEWNYFVPRQMAVVAVTLDSAAPNPFLPDTVRSKLPPLTRIESEGLVDRMIRAPIAPGDYDGLVITADAILYGRLAGNGGADRYQLVAYGFDSKQEKLLADRVDSFSIDASGRAIAVRRGEDYAVLPVGGGGEQPLATRRMVATIVPRQEWAAIFDEVWRRYRDLFYDAKMHGFDWAAIGARYRAQLPRIGSRGDLTDLIGRMVAELDVGHAYIDGADEQRVDAPRAAGLGATFAYDRAAGRWRIARILAGDPADPRYRSPLGTQGVDARPGDALLAIDGVPLDAATNPYRLLRGRAEQQVALTVQRDGAAPRTITVTTIAGQEALLYFDWVERNRKLVDRLSGGRIGYLHLPAMTPEGLAQFSRYYFGQIRKDGMLIDVRGNLGGSVSPILLDRLGRRFLTTGQVKGMDYPTTYPWGGFTQVFTGRLALVANEATMSDGDTMAWEFRQMGLGPIIGKRTWGGTVGTGDSGPLLDGTDTQVPQFALADTQGRFVVEGTGVFPDVDADYDVGALRDGGDPQLAKAVETLLATITGRPGTLPPAGSPPDRAAKAQLEQK